MAGYKKNAAVILNGLLINSFLNLKYFEVAVGV